MLKKDVKKYSTEQEKRECIEIYSNVINELRNVIYEYNLAKGINVTDDIYQDSVKPKLLYENNLISFRLYGKTETNTLSVEEFLEYINKLNRR